MNNSREVQISRRREGLASRRKTYSKIRKITSRAPQRNSAEVPILVILSRCPASGIKTKIVLEEVRSARRFPGLSEEDLHALNQHSMKRVVDSIIKYSRKQLVLKGQIYPIGENCQVGIWKITNLGVERVLKEGLDWIPTYSERPAVVLDYDNSYAQLSPFDAES